MKTLKNKNKKTNKTLKNKDIKSKPNDDFYTFVNHSWIHSHTLRKNKEEINTFIEMQNHVNNDLLSIVKRSKKMNTVFKSFMNSTDRSIRETISKKISKLNDFRKDNNNFYPFLAWMKQQGFVTPIHFDIEEDPKNNQCFIATIEGGAQGAASALTLDEKSAYKNSKTKDLLLEYYKKIFSSILGNNHTCNTSTIYDKEKKLIQKTMTIIDTQNMKKIYHKYTPSQFKTTTGFDFDEFIRHLPKNNKNPSCILVQNPKFIRYAMTLMKTWNDESWRAYWMYQIIKIATHLHEKLFKENTIFLSHFYNIIVEKERKDRALHLVNTIYNTELNKQYLASCKKIQERKFALDLINIIKKVLRERLQKNAWLQETTKKHAVEKLDNMHFVIGFNDSYEPDPFISFSPDNGLENQFLYNQWKLERGIQRIETRTPKKNVWLRNDDLNTFDVNAFYTLNRNELILPNAILSRPFTDLNKSVSYNFAQLGTSIGHEMMHAYDNDGYQYDKNGNYDIWWSPKDLKKYKEKQDLVKKQYSEYAKRDNYNIPVELNMGENIADISGFLITEEGLCRYMEEKNTPKEKIHDILQEFYICYAKQWRSTMKPETMQGKIDHDLHTIGKYRVNCVLSRSKLFQEIYGIKKGDAMYYDTTDEIW